MVGRFIGAYLCASSRPGKSSPPPQPLRSADRDFLQYRSEVSGYSLLAIGLCNSIMFPTIFTLASQGLGKRAAEGSGIICMAIVAGVVPIVTGKAADLSNLKWALVVPAACYAASCCSAGGRIGKAGPETAIER